MQYVWPALGAERGLEGVRNRRTRDAAPREAVGWEEAMDLLSLSAGCQIPTGFSNNPITLEVASGGSELAETHWEH